MRIQVCLFFDWKFFVFAFFCGHLANFTNHSKNVQNGSKNIHKTSKMALFFGIIQKVLSFSLLFFHASSAMCRPHRRAHLFGSPYIMGTRSIFKMQKAHPNIYFIPKLHFPHSLPIGPICIKKKKKKQWRSCMGGEIEIPSPCAPVV